MKGEEKFNYFSVIDKKISASIKERAWDEVLGHISEIRDKIASADKSKSDKNWQRDMAAPDDFNAVPEKALARAIAEALEWRGAMADLPACLGLLGENKGRGLDLVTLDGEKLGFVELSADPTAEDIVKGMRELIVLTALYRAFLDEPARFGFNTSKSLLLIEGPVVTWEIVGPLDLINPKRADLRWLERDIAGIQSVMKALGVESFSLGRFQADSIGLKSALQKGTFTPSKARQWFENRGTVLVA